MSGRWKDSEEEKLIENKRKEAKERKRHYRAINKNLNADSSQKIDDENAHKRRNTPESETSLLRHIKSPHHTLQNGASGWDHCRTISDFERLNHIEEGSYGSVSRALEIATGQIVALKKVKIDSANVQGFPVTSLREIQCLIRARHRHIVQLREVVMGNDLGDIYLVMDFIEHDLKTLHDDMSEPFLISEAKTIMSQLASAVEFLHSHWILHRDLKTSNILLNNRGEIKVADFGMARLFGDPPPKMTQLVVTLWYRSPELLLGLDRYDQSVDIWSLGCIFGELLTREPLFQGKTELDQLSRIFEFCGAPTDESWPGYRRLPNARTLRPTISRDRSGADVEGKFPQLSPAGIDLLLALLSLDPCQRPTATAMAAHRFFRENPKQKSTTLFPTFPSKAAKEKQRRRQSPPLPSRG